MIWNYYFRSIKTRLILNVIIVHAILIGFVIYDMFKREKAFMYQQLIIKGQDMTSILASNAAQHLLNQDFVALSELLSGAKKKNIQDKSFILDKDGKVLASLPNIYFNQILDDNISVLLMQNTPKSRLGFAQILHDGLVDTMVPIDVEGDIVGYVRVILNSEYITEELRLVTQRGIIFLLLAIVFGSLFAWLSVNQMTRKLQELTSAAHQLAQQNFNVKLPEIDDKDEVGTVIEAFGVMQKSIHHYIEELRTKEERLKLAHEGTNDGLWDWNLVTNEVYYSNRWKEMLGYGENEIQNSIETWRENLHPEDLESTMDYLWKFFESSQVKYEQKFRIKTKSGDYIPILSRGQKIFNEQGELVRLVGTHVDLSKISKMQEKLQHLAHHDLLTDLPNRRLYLEKLDLAIKHAKEYKLRLAVLFLDLDNFKQINDTLGHQAGDRLLQVVSQTLRHTMRKSDIISRFGGDEFTIVVTAIENKSTVVDIIAKIMKNINALHNIDGNKLYTTISIGIALYPEDGASVETLLKNADRAMYEAKNNGRNNYRFYTDDLTRTKH